MKLGFLTACLPGDSLADIAAWAGGNGYTALEVAAWPRRRGRDWEASHLDVEPWVSGWWRYRIPGLGEVDWRRLIDRLHHTGYDGVVSVEHEDPVWSGDPERVRRGLAVAERTLAPLVNI
jgi:sugar phosphate isomerase/epimerase